MQQLLGLLQFIANASPPARVFTNRMLSNLREMSKKGTDTLSWGFKKDLLFFGPLAGVQQREGSGQGAGALSGQTRTRGLFDGLWGVRGGRVLCRAVPGRGAQAETYYPLL